MSTRRTYSTTFGPTDQNRTMFGSFQISKTTTPLGIYRIPNWWQNSCHCAVNSAAGGRLSSEEPPFAQAGV